MDPVLTPIVLFAQILFADRPPARFNMGGMPSLEVCYQEAAKFLMHEFETEGHVIGRAAMCIQQAKQEKS